VTENQVICATCKLPIKQGDSVIWVEPPLEDPRRRVMTVHRDRHAWCMPYGWIQVSEARYFGLG
jgi:hypothetical protein